MAKTKKDAVAGQSDAAVAVPARGRGIAGLTYENIDAMPDRQVAAVCRVHDLPTVGVESAEQRQQIKALMQGGDKRYVHGYTLCPVCKRLARRVVRVVRTERTVTRWVRCCGPEAHTMPVGETV